MKLVFSYANIISSVEEVYLSYQKCATDRHIDYKLIKHKDKLFAYFDKNKFEKALSILLSNAFKFTPDHGKISIQITQKNNWVIIQIIDNGKGISSKNIEKLFNKFFQVCDADLSKDDYEDGLSLSKNIIELHEGKIDIISETAENKKTFTMFVVSLQLGDKHLDKSIRIPKYTPIFYDN